jgi:lactate 2-monooxygenase
VLAPGELFGNYQYEIYLRGMAGEAPVLPVDWSELERAAEEAMEPTAAGYVFGGGGSGDTMRANREAFRRHRIVPRFLRDVGDRDLSVSVAGTASPAPVWLAPVGVQTIVHPEGELASAAAAAALGLPFVASTVSGYSMEQIAEASGDSPRWFQLYIPNDPELTRSFLRRAEAAGYSAVVVTLDNYILAWRPRDLRTGYLPFLQGQGIANYLTDPVFGEGLPEGDDQAAVARWAEVVPYPNLTWDDIDFVRENTSLPVLLKGILHPDDALEARERDIDGLVVSNHGGRQVDGAVSALEALPEIVEAVGGELPLLLDSGVRSGSDVMKALALGATAVQIGRPYIWGLALRGREGVEIVLRSLLAELDLTLALSGYTRPSELGPDALRSR